MKGFTLFINFALRLLFFIPIIWAVRYTYLNSLTIFSYSLLSIVVVLCLILYLGIKWKVNPRLLWISIFLMGLVIRILWFLNIDSLPVSDFGLMYRGGEQWVDGELYIFRDPSYFARFPHMTMTVIYFGLIQKLFPDPITMVRIINIGLSMLNIVTLYWIARQIFKDRNKSLGVMFLAGIFPPMIYFNNVFASENLAMPLFILSVLFYLKATEKKRIIHFIFSGVFLSLTHLFRPIGYVVLVAYVMYGVIYYQDELRKKIRNVLFLILSSILPFILMSSLLIGIGITQYPLWHGTEPLSVSVLKGTNISSNGRWNAEDAALAERLNNDYSKVDLESRRIIKERFSQNSLATWVEFFINKYGAQWEEGDFGGSYSAEAGRMDEWTQEHFAKGIHSSNKMIISMDSQGILFNQAVWIGLLVLSYIGLFRKETYKNSEINLFYILYCGFGLFYLITESQPRYGYIGSWVFLILAVKPFVQFQHK
jgi:hypothetical protein